MANTEKGQVGSGKGEDSKDYDINRRAEETKPQDDKKK